MALANVKVSTELRSAKPSLARVAVSAFPDSYAHSVFTDAYSQGHVSHLLSEVMSRKPPAECAAPLPLTWDFILPYPPQAVNAAYVPGE